MHPKAPVPILFLALAMALSIGADLCSQARSPAFIQVLDQAWKSLPTDRAPRQAALEKVLADMPSWDPGPQGSLDRLEYDAFRSWSEAELGILVHPVRWVPDPLPTPSWDPVRYQLLNIQPLGRPEDVDLWIDRLARVPGELRAAVLALHTAQDADHPWPRRVLTEVSRAVVNGYLHTPAAWGNLEVYFRSRVADEAARQRVRALLEEHVVPAYRWAAAQLDALADGGSEASTLCSDPASYRALVRYYLGEDVDPVELHDRALAELEVLDTTIDSQAPPGPGTPYQRLQAFLKTEPLSPSEDFDWARRTVEELRTLAARWVSAPIGDFEVRFGTQDVVANYTLSHSDPGRPGLLNLPSGTMVKGAAALDLLAHEGIPGHALQLGLQRADQTLPLYRSRAWPPAFVEGWAVYAETLVKDSPQGRSPFYGAQVLESLHSQAAQTVLDTGLNALGWTHDQARAFLEKSFLGGTLDQYDGMIDQVLYDPAQRLTYDYGFHQMVTLRDDIQRAEGAWFDLRRFHDRVLRLGAWPFPLVRRQLLGH